MTETIPQPRTQVDADRIEDTAPESAKPGLLVFAPLRIEANAVRRGLTRPGSHVLRTGMGSTRAKKSAAKSQPLSFGATVVMGTAAGLSDDLAPGDLVVATEVSDGETTIALPGAALLAAELRRAGLNARAGRLVTVGKLVRSAERVRLASDGYLRATLHRVVAPPAGIERVSVAFFLGARLDETVPLLQLPAALAAQAHGPESDPNNPLFRSVGQNYLKGRLRSHPDVARRHHPDLIEPGAPTTPSSGY